MMDFHVLTPAGPELLMQVVSGRVIIVPPPARPYPAPQEGTETSLNFPAKELPIASASP